MELPKSITAYLDTLTPVEQDRVLTTRMEPVGYVARSPLGLPIPMGPDCGCLMMTAQNVGAWGRVEKNGHHCAGMEYEFYCRDHGIEPVNAAIRDYICELRATRELASVREAVTA